MALRGIKPEKIEKRLKVFFYGESGSGKTTASIQFPSPYLIDTEKGAQNSQYVDLINKQNGAVFNTSDFDEMIKEIKSLLTEKHNFKTLIIDPLTILYNHLLDSAEKKLGNEFGRHYGEANKEMRRLMNIILRLDMNVIITSHAKKEYGQNLSVIGTTFDCYKKLDYLFDLVIEIKKQGNKRVGIVKKTRLENFIQDEIFSFSYEEIAKRYGTDILEKESTQEILARKDQLSEINHLIELLKCPQETIDKWLDKCQSSSLEEMTEDQIQKCIDLLRSKIESKNNN